MAAMTIFVDQRRPRDKKKNNEGLHTSRGTPRPASLASGRDLQRLKRPASGKSLCNSKSHSGITCAVATEISAPSTSRQLMSRDKLTQNIQKKQPPYLATSADSRPGLVFQKDEKVADELLSCPICHKKLIRSGPPGLTRRAIERSSFKCDACRKHFSTREGYVDLVITSGAKEYSETRPNGTELFRNPLVSFAYERGWRQNFARAGFPGADEEFAMAQRYLEPAKGGVLLDVSCGSGLFSRRFAASGAYAAVVASDFSETMLTQTSSYMAEDRTLLNKNVILVRADVARLPFASASLDGIHAGAALHCWPSPSLAVSEISRVLRPGGVFVATTFLAPSAPFGEEFVKPIRKVLVQNQRTGMRYWEEDELEELCGICGLVDYEKVRIKDFIILSARKAE